MHNRERIIWGTALSLSVILGQYTTYEATHQPPLNDPRVTVIARDQEKLLGYLCHETNMRSVASKIDDLPRGNQRLMSLEECRQFRDEAYQMALEVPTPTPLPEIFRKTTTGSSRRAGP